MIIHVVTAGDTVSSIAQRYGVAVRNVLVDNGLQPNDTLVIGQALAIQIPRITHIIKAGESVYSIAKDYGISVKQLYRNNFFLGGRGIISPGDSLVILYENQGEKGSFITNSYAYTYVDIEFLRTQLPYLSYFTPFTYGITQSGGLVDLDDVALIEAARENSVKTLMHLSTLTEEGNFSNERASLVFNNAEVQNTLIDEIVENMRNKGYNGLDVDFEFIYPEERYDYINFLNNLRVRLNPLGYPLLSAVAPKISDTQRGVLYEGHDYAGIGGAANAVLLMTYEWGYTFGPPLAVAPLPNVRKVAEYALTRIPANKLFLGIPTYGYDWTLPYVKGNPGAPSLSPVEAVNIARQYGAEIQFDETAMAPWFRYTVDGVEHEVWFEDARSIQAKLALAKELNFIGIGYWNSMRDFPQNWIVINNEYNILDEPDLI